MVEDDATLVRLYQRTLRAYRVRCVDSGTAALRAMAEGVPDLIILDHDLADGEKGADFLPRLKAAAAHVPVILVSGALDVEDQLRVLQGPLPAHYVRQKPLQLADLVALIDGALAECGLGETVKMLQSLERSEKIDSHEPVRRFTERLARQHELLNRLRKATERPSVSALSREFSVSRKTIQRDLRDLVLRGQVDADVYPEAGHRGSDDR